MAEALRKVLGKRQGLNYVGQGGNTGNDIPGRERAWASFGTGEQLGTYWELQAAITWFEYGRQGR